MLKHSLYLLGHILAEGAHLAELRWVVVIKRVDRHPVVELLDVVRSLRTQIVDFVVILKHLEIYYK